MMQTTVWLYAAAGCLLAAPGIAQPTFDPARGILLRGTVVTMDDAGTILPRGNVLVRSGKIVWASCTLRSPPGLLPMSNGTRMVTPRFAASVCTTRSLSSFWRPYKLIGDGTSLTRYGFVCVPLKTCSEER